MANYWRKRSYQESATTPDGLAKRGLVYGGKAGGALAQDKIHTLRNNTTYVMSFYNTGNQTTNCHMNLGWSEREPDHFRIIDPVDPAS